MLGTNARRALHRLAQAGVWAAMLALGTPAAAQPSCPPRHNVQLADGSRTCLTQHAIGQQQAPGFVGTVAQSVPPSVWYSLAVGNQAPNCPPAVGLHVAHGAVSQWNPSLDPAARQSKALSRCGDALRSAGAAEGCQCTLLVADGTSAYGAADFRRLAGANATASVAQAASPAAVPAASSTASSTVSSTASSTAPTPPATGPAPAHPAVPAAEVLALREQLKALEEQVRRQQAAAAPLPTPATPQLAPAPPRARALVIGNGRYQHLGVLPNPANDANAIAERLRRYGIEVDLVLDADRSTLVRALAQHQRQSAGSDLSLFFYAGHGLQVDGINYIVPVEMAAEGVTAGAVKLNAVSLNDALEYLPSKTRLVFLDACRDNPLTRSLRLTRSSAGPGLAPIDASSGTLVAYATKDGSTAEDGRGRHSPYTEALLAHLDAPVDIAIVLRRVRQAVLAATGHRQEPWEYGSLVGDTLVLSQFARRVPTP